MPTSPPQRENYPSDEAFHQAYLGWRSQVRSANRAAGQPPTAPPATPAAQTNTTQDQSAKAIMDAALATYGLSALSNKAWTMYLSGMPEEQIWLELRQTTEYKTRFAGMEELSRKGRAISEAEYIGIERDYVSLMRRAGIPEGFYDSPADLAKFIADEVSPTEFGERLEEYRTLAFKAPPETRAQLTRLYGMTLGDQMAFIMDPTKALPVIQRQANAAIGAALSEQAGFGVLTLREAERLGDWQLSIDQMRQGFQTLGESGQLLKPLAGDAGEDTISKEQAFEGVFGANATQSRRMRQRARKRTATFDEGADYTRLGGFGTSNS